MREDTGSVFERLVTAQVNASKGDVTIPVLEEVLRGVQVIVKHFLERLAAEKPVEVFHHHIV
jgi:hypothetical protein